MTTTTMSRLLSPAAAGEDLPLWYKDAVIYEVHLRAFADSNGDGIGDLPGLTSKLDYLQDLGVTALWLLPFYPSPLRDDGYDIADYMNVNPVYGSLADFRRLLREAHRRGLRVITELVLNHTSDQHPWFQAARRARPGTRAREFYVWSDTPDKYRDARIIFKDFEKSNWTWDPVAGAYYWHRFYSHQPDLNYDSPHVQKAMLRVVDFWFGMGVDGMRLDAVPYLFEREGTSCENLPETHTFLKQLRRHVDERYPGRMLLAEANQWPVDARAYFGNGDECHMAFNFPLMPRMFMSLHMEDRAPIVDIMEQTPAIPENCQWAIFLRNHDELTLEMVTEEERDYMYRVYAHNPQARINLGIRRRLAPLLGNNRRRLELLNGLMFSLPGTVVIYYGDEIGMGDNFYLGDRDGVRTPMQWSGDRNAGFSRANPQRLYLPVITDPEYHYEAVNVEAQQANTSSLLWWMKRLIALRKRYRAFGNGSLEFLHPENRKVIAFIRRYQDETVLVIANLSRFAQGVELDLSAFKGAVPVELFGQTRFPRIGELPYFLTLGPHSFFWFALELAEQEAAAAPPPLPPMVVRDSWTGIFRPRNRAALETRLLRNLVTRAWFAGKDRTVQALRVLDVLPLAAARDAVIALVEVQYTQGSPETYQLAMAFEPESPGREPDRRWAIADVVVRARGGDVAGVVVDPLPTGAAGPRLLHLIRNRRRLEGDHGTLHGVSTRALRALTTAGIGEGVPSVQERKNTVLTLGERAVLKVFRPVAPGPHPELELGRFLTARGFGHVPRLLGALEYRTASEPWALAVLYEYVPDATELWQHTLDTLTDYWEHVLAHVLSGEQALPPPLVDLFAALQCPLPDLAHDLVGRYLETVRLLGQRTAEFHLTLASETDDPAFAPEPFSEFYRLALHQAMRSSATRTMRSVRRELAALPETTQARAQALLERQDRVEAALDAVRDLRLRALRTRYHGDYQLGQVLYTGLDVVIIDLEGETARALSDRRIKRSPLRDVASMVRSFAYAAHTGLLAHARVHPEHAALLEPWKAAWDLWVSHRFVSAYLDTMGTAPVLPPEREHTNALLRAFLVDQGLAALEHEVTTRPDWATVPLEGLLRLLS